MAGSVCDKMWLISLTDPQQGHQSFRFILWAEEREEGKRREPQNKALSSAWRSFQKPVIIFSWIRELER